MKEKYLHIIIDIAISFSFIVLINLIYFLFPLQKLAYIFYINLLPHLSKLDLWSVFIVSYLETIIFYTIYYGLLIIYAYFIIKTFIKINIVKNIGIVLILIYLINVLVPMTDFISKLNELKLDNNITVLEEKYVPAKQAKIPENVKGYKRTLLEHTYGLYFVKLKFVNTTNQILTTPAVIPTGLPFSYTIACSYNDDVALLVEIKPNETWVGSFWCEINDLSPYNDITIKNNKPIKLSLKYFTKITLQDAKIGTTPTVSYNFETSSYNWFGEK